MQSEKNLWGNLPSLANLNTPFTLLKQQAAMLGKMTDGLLVGDVLRDQRGQDFIARLRINVPALNSYIYNVVEVNYPAELYPLKVTDLTGDMGKAIPCASEEEFEQVLSDILSSESVRRVVTTLLVDLRAETSEGKSNW